MSMASFETVTITVNVSELRKTLIFGLGYAADNMLIQGIYGRVLNDEGIVDVIRIHEIFFPGEDVGQAIEMPEKIMSRARNIMIDAWAGCSTENEPPIEELLKVEKLLFRYRYENWFEQANGGSSL